MRKLKYDIFVSPSMPFYVLKIGGSLIGSARELIKALDDLVREGYVFLVVPGGGPMADLVRDLQTRLHLSDEASHWMAILSMEEYAYILADGTGAVLTGKIEIPEQGVKILLPYRTLLEDDSGIEHSWDFTSDAVAALAASRLSADMIKATNVEGVILGGKIVDEIDACLLKGTQTCIDQGCLDLLNGRSCRVIDGRDPERFVDMIRSGRGGTVIKG